MARLPYANERRINTRRRFLMKAINTAGAGAEVPTATYSIAGNIVDALDAALEDVAVTVYAEVGKTTALKATTTDESGDYSLGAGWPNDTSFYVEAVLAAYTADEDPLTVAISDADVDDADFVLTAD